MFRDRARREEQSSTGLVGGREGTEQIAGEASTTQNAVMHLVTVLWFAAPPSPLY